MKARVTQQQVADAAGVHRTTVSLALKNSPKIPPETRDRVRTAAKELGYVPDPLLMALTQYRNSQRPSAYQGTLAWLTNDLKPMAWRNVPHYVQAHEGAKKRALALGYRLEVVGLHDEGRSARRTAAILRARNIQGVILNPLPKATGVLQDFPWQDFCPVAIGYSLVSPQLHTVASTQYRAMLMVLREVRRRGYERIGLVLNRTQDEKADHHFLAGFLVDHFQPEGMAFIPPFFTATGVPEAETFMRWYAQHHPEVIVTGNARLLEFLGDRGLRAPQDVGVACIALPHLKGDMAGVHEAFDEVGRVAVDQVTAMIAQGDKGVPKTPLRIGVDGQWHEGTSLRPPPA